MEPLNLAICDDLPEEREKLLALLEQAPLPQSVPSLGAARSCWKPSVPVNLICC